MSMYSDYRRGAREKLKGNWGQVVLTFFVYMVITQLLNFPDFIYRIIHLNSIDNFFINYSLMPSIYGSASFIKQIIFMLLSFIMSFGLVNYFLKFVRNGEFQTSDLFFGFYHIGKCIMLGFIQSIFIFLWMLLLIIPGIIKAISYSQAFYILRDNPDISAMEAITESRRIMDGNKTDYFILGLSFIGWFILCSFTFGIGFLWLGPYVQTTFALFYEDIKGKEPEVENEYY